MFLAHQKSTGLLLSFLLSGFFAIAQLTPHEAIPLMQKGINLGNTHEPPTEAGWNNPKAQEYYFDMYQEEGFQLVRIPVRWDNYTGKAAPYKVDEYWINRIEQLVDWGLERGLFIVINSHHDSWIKEDYSSTNKVRFDSIWSQISERLKDKSERLLFEILNEPHGLSKANNDDMHARILSIIRKTNPTRIVIFQGNNWGGSDDLIHAAIPDDDYIIGSFHSYDPYLFGLEGEGKWGSTGDYNTLENKFISISDWSVKNNIPVFLGEFGALKKCDYTSRMKHYRAYTTFIKKYGFAGAAWDDGGDFRIMERQQHKWNEIKDILTKTTVKSPTPTVDVYQDSIIRVRWQNNIWDHDNIFIQRKLETQQNFTTIATIKPDTNMYYDIKPAMMKTYHYRIIAHYNDTTDLYSQPYAVDFPFWKKKIQTPFSDTLLTVPGVIEAEYFDNGGEGLSYHDADQMNNPGDFRPTEGVDIYSRLGEGYHIGNALKGEWVEYTIDVKTEGWYTVTSQLAALIGGGTFQISVDTVVTEILAAPSCFSWLNTLPVTTNMYLKSGVQVMRFTILDGPNFNIDKFEFDLATATNTIQDNKQDPFFAFQNKTGEIIIRKRQNKQIQKYNIYNLSGTLIQSIAYPEPLTSVPLYKTPSGIYIIQSISNHQKHSQKVFVK